MSRAFLPVVLVGLVWLCIGAGCSSPSLRADFSSLDPAERTRAIAAAAQLAETERGRDPKTTQELIEELDSSDAAVRMLSINTLERITGERLGYDWAAARSERREAIARWVEWQRTNAVRPAPGAPTP